MSPLCGIIDVTGRIRQMEDFIGCNKWMKYNRATRTKQYYNCCFNTICFVQDFCYFYLFRQNYYNVKLFERTCIYYICIYLVIYHILNNIKLITWLQHNNEGMIIPKLLQNWSYVINYIQLIELFIIIDRNGQTFSLRNERFQPWTLCETQLADDLWRHIKCNIFRLALNIHIYNMKKFYLQNYWDVMRKESCIRAFTFAWESLTMHRTIQKVNRC